MRYIYTICMYLLTPFILCRLYWKSRRLASYRYRISERFSLGCMAAVKPVDIWIHAVSLGEVIAITPLIEALLAQNLRILISTMTPTGSERVISHFGHQLNQGHSLLHQYIPYDLPWALKRFFKKFNPRLAIIMETELWPNTIYYAHSMNIQLLLVNARLSDHAFRQYEKISFICKPMLNKFSAIFAQSQLDAERFIAIGAKSGSVSVLGNMKFDLKNEVGIDCNFLKNSWGVHRIVLIAASTHDDEDKQILLCLNRLKVAIPNLMLLLAPRHPERFNAVYKLGLSLNFNTKLRSMVNTIDSDTDVLVIDSLGELNGFYKISDYAFVGGSLVPVGGHNILEPIAAQVPVFCGIYMHNFKEICRELCKAQAMVMVENVDGLIAALIDLHSNNDKRAQQILNASMVLAANRGAVTLYLEKIKLALKA